jgi:hypothetical protein
MAVRTMSDQELEARKAALAHATAFAARNHILPADCLAIAEKALDFLMGTDPAPDPAPSGKPSK